MRRHTPNYLVGILVTPLLLVAMLFAESCTQATTPRTSKKAAQPVMAARGTIEEGENTEEGEKTISNTAAALPEMVTDIATQIALPGTGELVTYPSSAVRMGALESAMTSYRQAYGKAEVQLTHNARGPFNKIVTAKTKYVLRTMEHKDAERAQQEIFANRACMQGYGTGKSMPAYTAKKLNSALGRRKYSPTGARHTSFVVYDQEDNLLMYCIAGGGAYYNASGDSPIKYCAELAFRPSTHAVQKFRNDQAGLHAMCIEVLGALVYDFLPILYNEGYNLPDNPNAATALGPVFKGIYATEPPSASNSVFNFEKVYKGLGFFKYGHIGSEKRDLWGLQMKDIVQLGGKKNS